MKKLIALLLAACMILSLCACGDSNDPVQNDDPQNGNPVAGQEQTPVDQGNSENPEDPNEGQNTGNEDPVPPELTPFELAQTCIDLSVEELYELIGEPESFDYAPSCLNPDEGEDGNLYYDGFIVYTYREGETETVSYVEEIE